MQQHTAIEAVKGLHQEFSVDTLIERLIFIEKVQTGLQQLDAGEIVSHEEAVKRTQTW